ncbi:MAG: hypothetical protein PF961_05070 [Planctomycetota bacterium]|jgi:hypothetical protein|nr:hypothetical protein [Planctomycetota bacterium]
MTGESGGTSRIHVVQYSSLDETVYVQWDDHESRIMAAVPKDDVLDHDPSPLCNRLRDLGADIDNQTEADTAAEIRDECTRRFPSIK